MQLIKIVLLCFMLLPIAACNSQPISSDSSLEERMKEFKRLQTELDKQAKTKFLIYMSLKDMFADKQVRALAKAAGKGQIKKINKLVEAGVNVNAKGALGATPLFRAFGNIKGFKRLLELGANPNAMYEDGGTILNWAVRGKNKEFLKLAIQYGGDINALTTVKRSSGHETPLMKALVHNEDESVRILLDAGADVNVVNKLRETAYRLAARQGKFKFLLEMLEMGANYQKKNLFRSFRISVAQGEYGLGNVKGYDDELINTHLPYLPKVKAWLSERGVDIPSVSYYKSLTYDIDKRQYFLPDGTPVPE